MEQTFYKTFDKNNNFLRNIAADKVKTDLKENEYLKGVSCFIFQNNKILFETRSKNQDGGEILDLCSGHIDNNETPKEAMQRELFEELGIDKDLSTNIQELKSYRLIAPKRQSQKNWFMTFYFLNLPNNYKLELQQSEVKEISFCNLNTAIEIIKNNKLQFPYDDNMAEMLSKLTNFAI